MERNPHVSDSALEQAFTALASIAADTSKPAKDRVSAANAVIGSAYLFDYSTPGGALAPSDEPETCDSANDPAPGVSAGGAPRARTVNEHGHVILDRIEEVLGLANSRESANDLYEARAHIEDGLTRFNSAVYRINGTWDRADSERRVGWIVD